MHEMKNCDPDGDVGADGLKEKMFWGFLQNRKIILNKTIDDAVIEMLTMQIIRFNEEDDEKEAEAKALLPDGDDYLKLYDRKTLPIQIYINSNGGLVLDGLSVVSAIESSKTPVHTIATGKAISMGFMILIAGHRRFAQKYSTLMYHQIGSGRNGLVREIEEHLTYLSDLQELIESIVIEKTLIPKEVLDEVYRTKQDMYIDAAAALEYGVIDEVL